MTDPATSEALARIHGIAGDTCLRCGKPITSIGLEQFRVGGTGGGWKLLFGEFADSGRG